MSANTPNAITPTWAAELTPRERRFVEEYLIDLNGTEAAIRAGLGKTRKSSTEIASRMKRKATVAAAIAQLLGERGNVTSSRVVEELARVAFAKMADIATVERGTVVISDTSELTEDQQAAIAEISETVGEGGRTIKVKLHDKLSALDKLAKVLALYRDRLEVSGPNGKPIEVDHTLTDAKARLREMLGLVEEQQFVTIQSPPKRVTLPEKRFSGPIIDAD
ncbi:MAG: terminase small subunit [Pseudolabrys sp.]